MRDAFSAVLELQTEWTHENTPAMKKRGLIIRHEIPAELESWRNDLRSAFAPYEDDLAFEGSDATGPKARAPWCRAYSRRRSPSAQDGWYVVYIFRPDGAGVALCLSHGSTTGGGSVMATRSDEEAAELLAWAEQTLAPIVGARPDMTRGLKLGSSEKLPAAYEKTTALSVTYPRDALPTDAVLKADLTLFLDLLARLYLEQDFGRSPDSVNPEIAQALEAADVAANPLRYKASKGQGFGLTAAERKLVEMRAMQLARSWLKANGFSVEDVHNTQSYDYLATRSGQSFIVEVKGTTGTPRTVLITRNELKVHRAEHPNNILIVVHGIRLSNDRLTVSGGEVLVVTPWAIEDEDLDPVCYECRVPAG